MVSVIYTTVGKNEEAQKIARMLVEEKLVACVHIIPKILSIYRWKGKIQEDTEYILLSKTTEKLVEQTIERIRSLHSYEVPEILVFAATGGLKKYLEYVEDETV